MRIIIVLVAFLALVACDHNSESMEQAAREMCDRFYNIAGTVAMARDHGQDKTTLKSTTEHPNLLRVVDMAFSPAHKDKTPDEFAHWVYDDCMYEHLGND